MTKLNLKVVDMDNSIVDFAKSVSIYNSNQVHDIKSIPLSRITVRKDSSPTRSERHSISNKVSGIEYVK
jgi:hypothetical protein